MSFAEKFRQRVKQIDEELIPKPEQTAVVEVPRPLPKGFKRHFNIHKRSLPPGIDKIVVLNVELEAEAEWLIDHAVDSQGKRIFGMTLYVDDSKQSKTYTYYDVVPSDATPKERSIYYNKRELTKPEGSDPEPLEIVLSDHTPWLG